MNSVCRLCGEDKTTSLSVELNDKTSSNWIYRELVEFHTRIELKASKLLPQLICDGCRTIIESFAEFSQHIQTIQETFVDEPESHHVDCFESVEGIPGNFAAELLQETVIKEQVETEESSSHETDSEEEKSCQQKVKLN
jgi:hypothetical protein